MTALREQFIQFGPQKRLLGVLTTPSVHDPNQPVLVIPNTGVEHRVGPNRLHVYLARALAARGFATLRLDLGGMGDSEYSTAHATNSESDLREAITALEERRIGTQFALVGLCSGAHDAFQFALSEPRVAAVLLIDGYCYPTPKHQRNRLRSRFLHPLRTMHHAMRRMGSSDGPPKLELSWQRWPSQSEAAVGYQALLQRGVHLAFLFSGDLSGEYSYQDQHYECFPFLRNHTRLWFFPEMDHTLSRIAHRKQLVHLACDWLTHLAV